MNTYDFGEKKEEMGMPVWQSPKYIQSKEKAISKYNEALRLIEERRNEVMQNLDFQEETKAEMLREAELNSMQGEA